jgi:hypothetical protein
VIEWQSLHRPLQHSYQLEYPRFQYRQIPQACFQQGLPGVPGVDESNVIGDDDKEYEYHEKKDSFSSEEESTQKDLEPTNDMKESWNLSSQILSFDWLGFHLRERFLVLTGQILPHYLQIVYHRKFLLHQKQMNPPFQILSFDWQRKNLSNQHQRSLLKMKSQPIK